MPMTRAKGVHNQIQTMSVLGVRLPRPINRFGHRSVLAGCRMTYYSRKMLLGGSHLDPCPIEKSVSRPGWALQIFQLTSES
jgi:hypothetical protein